MLKNEKGITLIALIITIIVMVILIVVTINIALNGGLFTKASNAAVETEKRAILEQIIALAEWDNNGKINVKATVDNVKEEFGADKVSTTPNPVANGATSAIVTITGKHGEYNYKITTSEISITGGNGSGPTLGDDPQALSELERYFFNEDGTGKAVPFVIDDNENVGPIITFTNNEIILNAEKDIQFMRNEIVSLQDGIGTAFIEYKGADYKFEFQMLGENNYQTILGSDNEKITRVPTIYSGDTDEERIKQYFLGYSGEGKSLGNLVDIEKTFEQGSNPTNIILKDNDIINASTDLIISEMNDESFEVTYNQKKYVIEYEDDENFGMMISTTAIREDKVIEEKWGNPENDKYYYIASEESSMAIIITDTNKVILGFGNEDAFLPIGTGYVKDEITVSVAGEEKTFKNAILSTLIVEKYCVVAVREEDGRINICKSTPKAITNSKNEVIEYDELETMDQYATEGELPYLEEDIDEFYYNDGFDSYPQLSEMGLAYAFIHGTERSEGTIYQLHNLLGRKFTTYKYNYKIAQGYEPEYDESIPESIKENLKNNPVLMMAESSDYKPEGYFDSNGDLHIVDVTSWSGADDENGYPKKIIQITETGEVLIKKY